MLPWGKRAGKAFPAARGCQWSAVSCPLYRQDEPAESDGYATGLILYVLRQAGRPFSDNCRCKGYALWLGWRETQADDLASPGEAVLMSTTSESPAPVSGTSHKMLQLLCRRLRQLRRVTLALVIGLAVAATVLAIWWLNSLNGLPDIGDPFDVAAFGAFSIPDDQNAFALLRRANQMLTPQPPNAGMRDPRLREWVKASRPAVELFLKAAECPDAMSEPPDAPPHFISGLTILATPTVSTYEYPIHRESPGTLIGLTILEGEGAVPAAIRRAPGTAIGPSSA